MLDFVSDTFRQLRRISQDVKHGLAIKSAYSKMYSLFLESMAQATQDMAVTFGGPFAQMTQLCRQYDFMAHYDQLNVFRNRARNLHSFSEVVLQTAWLADYSIVVRFLSVIFQTPLPAAWGKELIDIDNVVHKSDNGYKDGEAFRNVMRVVVEKVGDEYFSARSEQQGLSIKVWYGCKNYYGDWTYLKSLLHIGTQVNLVHPYEQDNVWRAELYIIEPDFLVDVSAIAACFQEYGASSWHYQLAKLRPDEITPDILLGNFAGQLLDEAIYNDRPLTYAESIRHFFRKNALSVAACEGLEEKFHSEARRQKENLQKLVHEIFPTDRTIDIYQVLLEPSFFCEMLGLQGRMDLLQENLRVLMEQKSGRMDEFRHAHREKHYVQVLLYLAYLHYAFGIDNRDVSLYLLYSKYEGRNGLLKEGPAPALLFDALRIRNEIAWQEIGSACFSPIDWQQFYVDSLFLNPRSRKLWTDYARPRLEALISPLQSLEKEEYAYFQHMFGFIQREKVLAKMGGTGLRREVGGMAALWNATLEERTEAGDILCDLTLDFYDEKDGDSQGKRNIADDSPRLSGIEEIILRPNKPVADRNSHIAEGTNFRKGDVVVIYPYDRDSEPDVRRTLVIRAAISEIRPESIRLRLRAPQRNKVVFVKPENFVWAMEHDTIEASFSQLIRGLYAFVTMENAVRRQIVLGMMDARREENYVLKGTYGEFDELVKRAMQAKDFFLLIGPPGTGKTSTGMVNILKECLLRGESGVLLSAYTNRAVEEICTKLQNNGMDFLRIGGESHCSGDMRQYLLAERAKACRNVDELRQLLTKSRIIVGTVAALSAVPHLFRMKHFETAIIDEASQILEPHMFQLLAADEGKGVERFILIGDHKQLPAVVKQTRQAAKVEDAALRRLGIVDTTQSLFERLLLRLTTENPLVWQLQTQWRMHPDVAIFSNNFFYNGTLRAGSAPHQQSNEHYADLKNRLHFVNVKKQAATGENLTTSDKTNAAEAKKTAAFVRKLFAAAKREGGKTPEIGIIVPFRNQISTIREHLQPLVKTYPQVGDITIDTVERYQGSERDFIIYSTTVCRPQQLNFLCGQSFTDETGRTIDRKLNVALTRARKQTIVLGDAEVLRRNEIYSALIDFCSRN